MQRFLNTVFGSDGKPLGSVSVNVKKGGTSTNAELFSDADGTTTKANPFTSDSDGSLEFYAKNGIYDIVFTLAGKTFTDDNAKGIYLFDPRDDAGAVMLMNDFHSLYFLAAGELLADGQHWVRAGGVSSVTGDTTYRSGWIDVIETGGTAGSILLANSGGTIQLFFVNSTDPQILEARAEKVGDAVNGTRRIGLGSANLTSGDPTNGIYIRQIDSNNAFLVCRSGGTESTQDLGFTLNNPRRIRVTITTTSVRAFVENDSGVMVATTAITSNIPTAALGLSAAGGATISGGGCRLDYLNVITPSRV